ncbi:VWA domain-containing protein [Puniceicoccus vermicola]|uniref:VWA domain-containing protein n=1 Tax=Puniceicoccus vermicola TaxID=388746 RepID=A0A7X1AUY1_9BACT|nr:VWA domain-containing protein [Puniceicoccus vermicola]MBC2600488.1 VWA domain-containing protein [Puniceicoccus vermicola]
MNISNAFARNRALLLVIIISVALHLVAIIGFGAYKIVESITREDQTFEAPEIVEVPQQEPEYVVNLEQRTQSSSPPRPNPIVVDSPDVSIPALDIDVNIANNSSYGRGSGGFGSGGGMQIREMALDVESLEFFGKEMKSDAQRMLFVIDMSGSMVLGDRGVDGYRTVVEELIRTLRSIQDVGTFNIIAFSKSTDTYRGGDFVLATEDKIDSAEKWLMRLDPSEPIADAKRDGKKVTYKVFEKFRKGQHVGTRTDLALEEAFDMEPNIIILLSDGDPTEKKDAEVLKIVRKLQKDQGKVVPINTLSYKSKDGRAFLKQLAAENDGVYSEVN